MKTVFEANGVPVRAPPPRPFGGRGARCGGGARISAGRQTAGRRRGALDVPDRQRRAARRLARAPIPPASAPGAARAAGGRRRAQLRQRAHRRRARLALDLALPADAARGAREPVDPVGGPAAARHRTARSTTPSASDGVRGLRALGLRTGLTHMEWFRATGRRRSRSARSRRGRRARSSPSLLVVRARRRHVRGMGARSRSSTSSRRPERRYAVGAAYLRGQGSGAWSRVHGLDVLQRELGDLVVEARLPQRGSQSVRHLRGRGPRDPPRIPRPRWSRPGCAASSRSLASSSEMPS